ncbi:electron transport complex subunit RsxG [uncultured Porticoccus sp.]|uniref:electron transport complex subunit RsxG n=2 Tax=Porticoccus TaxID=1123967 RepID=UPI0026C66A7D|tara:strand:+ start:12885 stop:13571 length:687 start_codon:yes stop_codon:yes gene_type:complete
MSMASLVRSISFNSLLLGLFALITATLLSVTYLGTEEPIAEAKREVAKRALLEIVPLDRHTNNLLVDTVAIPAEFWPMLGVEEGLANIARKGDDPVAVILPSVAKDGYSGDIQMIIGINMDGTVAGVRVISHRETPGLGDKVDLNKSNWILGFNGKSLRNPPPDKWKVKKDGGNFDQFTGATITPRAVVNQVRKSLQYFKENREQLLKAAQRPVSNPLPAKEDAKNGG